MTEARLSHITPEGERQRRYRALREAMADNGLDAMLVCGRGDEVLRGRIQYVSIPGNDGRLRPGMVLSLHPEIRIDDPAEQAAVGGISISDNVLVTAASSARMTDDPDVEWVVL
ncbi:M24 family metallopeptidase [Micromonospora viridifaciens]|uniref:M24 family metallopeptidase n=1 Tax=Micromonospora viridifaciens TaxID=1881 RepID=UPI0012FE1ECE|nr:M24 family metallopeptidase [Micromonospora viridifaciens]